MHNNISPLITTLNYTALRYLTPHHSTLHHYITLHYTTLHYTTLYYTTPHYTTLHYTTPLYTTLHHTSLHHSSQEIKLQDNIERLTLGCVPRSMVIFLKEDLVDKFNPGDDVIIVGQLVRQWRPVMKGARCQVLCG